MSKKSFFFLQIMYEVKVVMVCTGLVGELMIQHPRNDS